MASSKQICTCLLHSVSFLPFPAKPNSLAPFFYEYLSLLYSLIVNKKCLQKFSLFGAYFINGHVLLSWNFYRFHFLSAFACCVDYATFPSILCALSLFFTIYQRTIWLTHTLWQIVEDYVRRSGELKAFGCQKGLSGMRF